MLYATASKNILIKCWRLTGSESNILKTIKLHHHLIDWREYTIPIKFSEYKSEMEEYGSGDKLITVYKEFTLCAESYFSGSIDGNSTIHITLYFDEIKSI
jgi:hypothetical protein